MSERELVARLADAGPRIAEHARAAMAELEALHRWLTSVPDFDHRGLFCYSIAADLECMRAVVGFYEGASHDLGDDAQEVASEGGEG